MRLELAWTVIPLLITMVMFVWGAKLYIVQSRAPANAMEIHVIGKQWMWKVEHPDGRREINSLTVPAGRPVKLIMTSQDVIHSFGIPAFRITQDVIPGRYSYEWFEATEPGEYHLFCREYCGTQHSGMIGTVRVLKPADYKKWVEGRPDGTETPEQAGEKLFTKLSCAQCHSQRGPSLAGVYGSDVQVILPDGRETTVKADYEYLRESIRYPRAKIVKGYPPDLMPSSYIDLTEEQVMELIAHIKTLGAGSRPGEGSGLIDPGSKMQEQEHRPPVLSTGESGNTGQR